MTSQQPVGVVLAGGSSSRMGRDKSQIRVAGLTLATRATLRLRSCCSEVLIADGGRRGSLLPGVSSVDDGHGRGPAAGILGAAAARPGRSLLVLACDLPLVPVALLDRLATAPVDVDLVVPGPAGHLEPLCARYGPRALETLSVQVAEGNIAPHRLAERDDLRVHVIGEGELREMGDPATMFANINRPEDLAAIEPLLREA